MPRAGLDQQAVIAAAADLADEEGIEAVSLARLAARFGVRPPSLYNHVTGLEGVRRDLALRGLRELSRRLGRAAAGKAADDAVMAVAVAYRAFAGEHPGLYAASLRAPSPEDAELAAAGQEVVEIVLAVLAGFGLRDDDALHATRGLRSVVHGFVSLEAAGGFGLPLDLDESYRRLVQIFIAGLRSRRTG